MIEPYFIAIFVVVGVLCALAVPMGYKIQDDYNTLTTWDNPEKREKVERRMDYYPILAVGVFLLTFVVVYATFVAAVRYNMF